MQSGAPSRNLRFPGQLVRSRRGVASLQARAQALKSFLMATVLAIGAWLPGRRPLPPTRHARRVRIVDILS
jgi:hypothetical protein